jgi:hypothetical protein
MSAIDLHDFEFLPLEDRNNHDLIITFNRMKTANPWCVEFNGVKVFASNPQVGIHYMVKKYINEGRWRK